MICQMELEEKMQLSLEHVGQYPRPRRLEAPLINYSPFIAPVILLSFFSVGRVSDTPALSLQYAT